MGTQPEPNNRELRVGGLTRLTTIDYPGQLTAVIFCQGCPWRCNYCHNTDLLPVNSDDLIPWSDVIAFLETRKGLLDAVVFSGGEPTMQNTLSDAIREVKAMGFKIGLHTAGCYPERLERVLPLLDWVGLDIKAIPEQYPDITGDNKSGVAAWQAAKILSASDVEYEIRTTAENILQIEMGNQLLLDHLPTTMKQHHRFQQMR